MPKTKSSFISILLFLGLALLNQCGSDSSDPTSRTETSHSVSENPKSSSSSSSTVRDTDQLNLISRHMFELTQTFCNTVERCDSRFSYNGCIQVLNSTDARLLWNNLGLRNQNQSNTQVMNGISEGTFTWNEAAYEPCLHNLEEICDNGEQINLLNYHNIENLVSELGECTHLISIP